MPRIRETKYCVPMNEWMNANFFALTWSNLIGQKIKYNYATRAPPRFLMRHWLQVLLAKWFFNMFRDKLKNSRLLSIFLTFLLSDLDFVTPTRNQIRCAKIFGYNEDKIKLILSHCFVFFFFNPTTHCASPRQGTRRQVRILGPLY